MPNFINQFINRIKNNKQSKYLVIGSILIFILINILGVINKFIQPPQLVSLPELDSLVDVDQELVFVFDKSPQNIKVVFHPGLKHQLEIYDNTLVVNPEQFYQEATQYQVELKHKNKTIHVLEFTTREMTETEVIEKDTQETLNEAPLIQYTPVENEQYYMTYTGPQELTIFLKQATQSQIEPQIKKWIEDKGIEADSHTLIFKKAADSVDAASDSNTISPTIQPSRSEEDSTKLFEITD